ncbi:hypothetical protein ABZX85_15155 [Streptomyces sp. NPDC004539]|uniref:hypothetical protein n=1 Tax=Streptomyces sp. NPDC004539 TaxID=3154280 RepID=UPI0033A511E9
MESVEEARHWLAARGIVETEEGWTDAAEPDKPRTANDVAHRWAGEVFTDDALDAAGRARLAFGLLDLLDDYWVTCELRFAADTLPDGALWAGYRRRLEAERDAEPVTYSLWVDWFEDGETAETAFAAVLADDIDHITATPTPELLRRAGRVLSSSGPVPWALKHTVYDKAARLPALHQPLFEGLLAGYHDVYGDLEPDPALTLLTSLTLPADTPHLTELRDVLTAGHRSHRLSPEAWKGTPE